MRIKPGVRLPETMAVWVMLTTAKEVVEGLGTEFVITSGTEGVHMRGSLHPKGLAFDFRTKTMLHNAKHRCADEIRRRLGDNYDVLLENPGEDDEHFHIEFDPK